MAKLAEIQHEQVMFCHDRDTGLRAIIAVHDTTLGPSLGGVRMVPYPTHDAALDDVLRLSEAMTYKAALAGLPLGGGKSVIIGDPDRDKTPDLLLAMARFVDTLGGRYIAGIDSGTSQDDLRLMGTGTSHVSCTGRDPSPATAIGVRAAIRAGVASVHGSPDLTGRRVAIQGTGHVGAALARLLAADGAELVLADTRQDQAAALARTLNARTVAPDEIFAIACDVFAPCALGGVINDDTLTRLDTLVVAGAANNALAEPRHGRELMRRGIRYAPDYCANAGGIIFLIEERNGNADGAAARIERIGDTLQRIWRRSDAEQIPAPDVAQAMAKELIARARQAKRA